MKRILQVRMRLPSSVTACVGGAKKPPLTGFSVEVEAAREEINQPSRLNGRHLHEPGSVVL